MSEQMAELVLGSVQLGMPYGAANRVGKPSRAAAVKLVRRAADRGIRRFDTARAYGDSESRLGEALQGRDVHTVTKLSPLSGLDPHATREEVYAAVDTSIAESLSALRQKRLDCLLLHRASHMTDHDGAIWTRLLEHVCEGRVRALGVSVQSPQEALSALDCPDVRHIQMPFNVLDWRWLEAGVIERCKARRDVTVHVRSVFLQGLLAAGNASIWPKIDGVDPVAILAMISAMTTEYGRESCADFCLAYARGHKFIHGVVIGLETMEQLDVNLRLAVKRPLTPVLCAEIEARVPRLPEQLLNPAQWPKA
ncbi:MAG: aldo/keto reductase [Alphaproteobacteria bacterium]|nr:aldo/keto reductase [Alphaproteobacteria bacterium]